MTPHQLFIQTRYQILGPYPNSKFTVGDIVDYVGIGMDLYPNLFRKVGWWEYRSIDDMPLYLKNFDSLTTMTLDGDEEPEVHKVKKHFAMGLTDWRQGHVDCFVSEWRNHSYNYNAFQPATEQEYLNQNNGKT